MSGVVEELASKIKDVLHVSDDSSKKTDEKGKLNDEEKITTATTTTTTLDKNDNGESVDDSSSVHLEMDTSIPSAMYRLVHTIQDLEEKEDGSILVLTGAGVSVAAGIPDFRTPGTGLYDNLAKYKLPYPQAVFDIDYYTETSPLPFCTLARELWPGRRHSPTLTHSFLALLAKKGLLLRNYSQNIDGLEYLAGIPADRLVECHGHFRTASCTSCGKPVEGEAVKETILKGDDSGGLSTFDHVPLCPSCGSYVKPDIVFFGESLPDRFHRLLQPDVHKARLLLILGTSLQVAPVSLIPSMVSCPRILLNREHVLEGEREGDAFLEGDCDASVSKLCELLGWHEELLELNANTRIREEIENEE